MSSVKFYGIFRMPTAIAFTPECRGLSVKANINGLGVDVLLPEVETVHRESQMSVDFVSAPSFLPKDAVRRLTGPTDDGSDWGAVTAWHRDSLRDWHANQLGLSFELTNPDLTYSDYLHGRGRPQGEVIKSFYAGFDEWFQSVQLWLEVLVAQDMNRHGPRSLVNIPGAGLSLLTIDNGVVSLPQLNGGGNPIAITFVDEPLVDQRSWSKAIEKASLGEEPKDQRVLLADAEAQLRRGHYRRAVIDAATALEVALNEGLEHELRNVGTKLAAALLKERRTLGPLIDLMASLGKVDTNLAQDVARPRNAAVHRGEAPTRAAAGKAIGAARRAIQALDAQLASD